MQDSREGDTRVPRASDVDTSIVIEPDPSAVVDPATKVDKPRRVPRRGPAIQLKTDSSTSGGDATQEERAPRLGDSGLSAEPPLNASPSDGAETQSTAAPEAGWTSLDYRIIEMRSIDQGSGTSAMPATCLPPAAPQKRASPNEYTPPSDASM